VGLSIDAARAPEGRATAEDAFGLVTLVPPVRPTAAVPRDLVVLLDTSGSMHGEPLAQAQRIAYALVEGLGEQDTFELIEFSTAPRRFAAKPLPATAEHRAQAIAWIRWLSAGGGTEMRTGILAALEGLRAEAQRQIVLVTDGHIGFEEEVLGEIARRLPVGSRVHTVGVGSSVNRSLTQAAARAGRGLELVVGTGEDLEPAVAQLLARTEAPLVVDLVLEGDALREHAPQRLPDLFASSPALVAARLRPEGGELFVRGRTAQGAWQARVHVPARELGEGHAGVIARFGREQVEDLELRHAVGEDSDREIEAIGVRFQIATRLTSWIAVSREATVDPGAPTRHEEVPQELPYGMSVEGLGLRMASSVAAPVPGSAAPAGEAKGGFFARVKQALRPAAPPPPSASAAPPAPAARPRPAPTKTMATPPREAEKEAAADLGRGRARAEAPEGAKKKAEQAPRRMQTEAKPAPRDEAGGGFAERDEEASAFEPPATAETTGAYAVLEADAEDDLDDRAAAMPAPEPMPSLGTLPGRVVLHRDGTLVVEVDVSMAFAWQPPASLVAITAEGESVLVTPAKGTTAAAELRPGMRLRLVLELPEGMPLPARLELEVGGQLLVIAPLGQA
jgi:Ca-activated chloride channel homolog